MVKPDKHLIIHIASIVGLVVAAHHFWPKGITYGEKEHWEKAYRKRHRLRKHHEKHLRKQPEDEMYSRDYISDRDHYEVGNRGRVEGGYNPRYDERHERLERPRYRDDDGFEYRPQLEYNERARVRH